MSHPVKIREDIQIYMQELKEWLHSQRNVPIEQMSDFFSARIDGYDEHMSIWHEAYQNFARALPSGLQHILDIGCGTGIELEYIFKLHPDLKVTGIDLSQDMLNKLRAKFPDKDISLVCANYLTQDFGEQVYDAVISFESLHHFVPATKQALFGKIFRALKPGGQFFLCDYIACCDEEESLLMAEAQRKRTEQNIPDDALIHFDTPLTAPHEISLICAAGFAQAQLVSSINGASLIVAQK